VDDHVERPGDAGARRGVRTAVAGALLLPVTLVLVVITPQAGRAAVFEVGLVACAALSVRGGVLARRALAAGTDRVATAFAGAMVGFVVGTTAAFVALWVLIGLAS